MTIGEYLRHLEAAGFSVMEIYCRRRALALWKSCGYSLSRFRRRLSRSPHVSSRQLMTVRQFLRFAGRKREAEAIAIPSPPSPPPLRPPTPGEVRAILATRDGRTPRSMRDRAILEFLYSAGLRSCEVARLTMSDLDLERGLVRVHGKGGRERFAPIGPSAVAWVARYLAEGRPRLGPKGEEVFVTQFGRGYGRIGVSMLVRRMAAGAGNRQLTAHALRRAAAAHCQREGMNLREVQEFLGHAKLETTVRYTGFAFGELKAVLDRLHPRSGMEVPMRRPCP